MTLLHAGLTDRSAVSLAEAATLLAVAVFLLAVAQIVAALLRWWLE